MCRSSEEYPPNGKRCLNRGSKQHQQEKRDAYNKRRRELYRERANQQKVTSVEAVSEVTSGSTPAVAPEHEAKYNIAREKLTDEQSYTCSSTTVASKPSELVDRKIAVFIAGEQTSPLSFLDVTEDSEDFAAQNESVNDVRRLTLEDGSVGYFKGFIAGAEKGDTPAIYGHTTLATAIHEVAAYKVAQGLGPEFARYVPETVLREYNDDIGSFQADAGATTLEDLPEVDQYWGCVKMQAFQKEDIRKTAILDYVMGSQDRHPGNIIAQEDQDGVVRPVLIDNGFGFYEEDTFPAGNQIISDYVESHFEDEDRILRPSELAALQNFYDSNQKATFLSPDSHTHMLGRVKALLDSKTILNVEELTDFEKMNW